MKILIVFATKEGQTEKIADHMSEILHKQGHAVSAYCGDALPSDFSEDAFDAAIIGGSVHINSYPGYLKKFVTEHREWLNSVPSAFFTVCMGINSKNPESREEASHFGDHFVERVKWHPLLIATFAGAVKYTKYDFITRLIMKQISKHEGGSTDTTHDHEYTDWNAVEEFARVFLQRATEKLPA